MPTNAEFLEAAATETLYVAGELTTMLVRKRNIRKAAIEELIERLNNARGFLETIIR